MADLVTHYLVGRVPGTRFDRPVQAAFVLGALLPDLISKPLEDVVRGADRFYVPSHTLLGLALYAYAASFLFEERVRARAWLGLWIGGSLHVAVDLLKDTMGAAPSAFFLFPFTTRSFEFALYDPAHELWTIPVVILVACLWEWLARRRGRYVWD